MGRKVSDSFTVPIYRLHRRELHRRGNERAWWESQGIDPLFIAATLWHIRTGRVGSCKPRHDPPMTNGKLNGRYFKTGAGAARQPENEETNSILRREAE